MNNYELHSRAHELAASHSGYNVARRLLALEEEFKEYRDSSSSVPYWLSNIASQLYQACGAYDMPDRVMDVLSDLQIGKRPKSVDILPVYPPQQAQGEAQAQPCYFCGETLDRHLGEHNACPDIATGDMVINPAENQRFKPCKGEAPPAPEANLDEVKKHIEQIISKAGMESKLGPVGVNFEYAAALYEAGYRKLSEATESSTQECCDPSTCGIADQSYIDGARCPKCPNKAVDQKK